MKKIIAILVFLSFSSSLLFAASSSSSSSSLNKSTTPEPYDKNEIPDWAKYLRRFEIVTLGSLPFTTMTATTVFTTIRWAKNDFDSTLIPNPFAFTSTEADINQDEQKIVLFSALGASLLIGLIDISIFIAKTEKAKKANRSVLPPNVTVVNKDEAKPTPNEEEQKNEKIEIPQLEVNQDELKTSLPIEDEPDVQMSGENIQ